METLETETAVRARVTHTGWSTSGDRNPGLMTHEQLPAFCKGG